MSVKALLFGSIGVIAETSDIQRRAYNQALAEAGLDWQWDEAHYRDLLNAPGGRARLRSLAKQTDTSLTDDDINTIHARKTEFACSEIVSRGVGLRPGVAALIQSALMRDIAVALVTTTYRENIDAIATAAGSELPLDRFAGVFTVTDADKPKPAPDIYAVALSGLQVGPDAAIALEDSAASVAAAKAAGVYTIAVPGEFTRGQDFSAADRVLESVRGFDLPQ
ncbi:MAG: HAD-IA family hydrolase [Pseudomonadota bacterium]